MQIRKIESAKSYTKRQVTFKGANDSKSFTQENKKLIGYGLSMVLLVSLGVLGARAINKNIKTKKAKETLKNLTNQVNLSGRFEGLNKLTSKPSLKKKLIDRIFMPLGLVTIKGDKELFVKNTLPNGIVLFGPKTSQKNFISELIGEHAEKLGMNFFKPEHVVDNSIETAKNIRDMFKIAEKKFNNENKFSFILLDKLDSYAKDRRTSVDNLKEASALLKLTENSSKRGAIWVAVADDIKTIDKALLDRATLIAPVEPPKNASLEVIKKFNEDLAYAREEGFIPASYPDFKA